MSRRNIGENLNPNRCLM